MSARSNVLQVEPIVEDVRQRGDAAVQEYTAKFDKVQLQQVCTPIEVRSGSGSCLRGLCLCARQLQQVGLPARPFLVPLPAHQVFFRWLTPLTVSAGAARTRAGC